MSIVHVLSFVGLVGVGLFLPFWVFIVYLCLYACVYPAYESLLIAVCIDAQFGEIGRSVWFMYTVSAMCILSITTFIRPHLRFYS